MIVGQGPISYILELIRIRACSFHFSNMDVLVINPCVALGVKSHQLRFRISKKFCSALGTVLS